MRELLYILQMAAAYLLRISSFKPIARTHHCPGRKLRSVGDENEASNGYGVVTAGAAIVHQNAKSETAWVTKTSQAVATTESICVYHEIEIPTSDPRPPSQIISVEDLTPSLERLLEMSGMKSGLITIISRHTTTSITINEWESRLKDDIADTLLKLIPPDERSVSISKKIGLRYKHNDIHLRPFGGGKEYDENSEEAQRCKANGWDVDDPNHLESWRDQEPINSHSHLLSIVAGSASESIPVVDSKLVLGQWQSVLLLDLDGPRNRKVGVQLMGYQ